MEKDRKLIVIITLLLSLNIGIFLGIVNERKKQDVKEKPYVETYEISTYSK